LDCRRAGPAGKILLFNQVAFQKHTYKKNQKLQMTQTRSPLMIDTGITLTTWISKKRRRNRISSVLQIHKEAAKPFIYIYSFLKMGLFLFAVSWACTAASNGIVRLDGTWNSLSFGRDSNPRKRVPGESPKFVKSSSTRLEQLQQST
jgi:hypothetical protein